MLALLILALLGIFCYIVVYDVETTGPAPAVDRVVQIAISKLDADAKLTPLFVSLIDPEIPIPASATAVHGITDADVEDAPTMVGMAVEIIPHFTDAEAVLTYNGTKFDNVVLDQEFTRLNLNFSVAALPQVDAMRLLEHVEPRNLSSVYSRLFGQELDGAHDADVDVAATAEIFGELLQRGGLQELSAKDLAVLLSGGNVTGCGRFKWSPDHQVIIAFGKHKNRPFLEALREDPQYFGWMKSADPREYSWLTADIRKIISIGEFHIDDEHNFRLNIGELYGTPEHDCLEHLAFALAVEGDEDGMFEFESARCVICAADCTADYFIADAPEPDEDGFDDWSLIDERGE